MADDTPPTFNLLYQPWIEVVDDKAHTSEVSIVWLLEHADRYRALASDLPTVDFAILRVLLAILYRAWDSADYRDVDAALDHWEERWNAPTLMDDAVRSYLNTVEDRFDLRHPKMPFFQVADLHNDKNEWKSLDILLPDVGDDGDLFTMRTDLTSISAAEAARMVIHCMAYDYSGIKSGVAGDPRTKKGKGYPMGVGWAGWLGGTLIEGDNLRETMLLNYVPYRAQAGTADLPMWEQPPMKPGPRLAKHVKNSKDPENSATGQVELFTWPQRRIRLRWADDLVTGVLVANGDPVGYTTKDDIETMTPWRLSEPQSKAAKAPRYMPLQLDPARSMWRSLGGILPNPQIGTATFKAAKGAQLARPAGTVLWLGTLIDQGVLPADRTVRIRMMSMHYGSNMSSFAQIAADSLTLTGPLMSSQDDRSRAIVRAAVDRAERTSKALGTFFRRLRFAVSGETEIVTDSVRRDLFDAIDDEFRSWITTLTPGTDHEAALVTWSRLLARTCLRQAESLETAEGPAVWTGRWDTNGYRVNAATAARGLKTELIDILGEGVVVSHAKEIPHITTKDKEPQ